MPHFVYILEMLSGHYYVGSTGNLKRRIVEHFKGRGDNTTKVGGFKRLLYAETYPNRVLAEHREYQLKRWSRAKKYSLVNNNLGSLRLLTQQLRARLHRAFSTVTPCEDGHSGDAPRASLLAWTIC